MQQMQFFATEAESPFIDVHCYHFTAGDAGRFHCPESDGAGADDEHELPGLDGGAANGVSADGQRFDKGQLIMTEVLSVDERSGWDGEVFHHAAVDVDAGHIYICAAVGFAGTTGDAFATVEVRDDGDGFAGLEAGSLVEVDEVAGNFMAEDARVFEIGLSTFEGMEIGAADADTANFDDRLAGLRQGCVGGAIFELSGLYANESFHCVLRRWLKPCRGGHSRRRRGSIGR